MWWKVACHRVTPSPPGDNLVAPVTPTASSVNKRIIVLQRLNEQVLMLRHVISGYACAAVLLCMIKTSDADGVYLMLPSTVVGYSDVNPSEARAAVDNNVVTTWDLTAGQTTANFSAQFDKFYTVSDTNH